ncbi:MAG: ABC transporter substrate-binding protein, partial [Reyranella sp.]|nr:ABC transporter substrate-binding protein [Reyranella sp.]
MRNLKWALAAATVALFSVSAQAQTLKVVKHSDVKIVDPIWTTAYIVRNHGYMIYDTLLALDDKLAIKPQMLEGWKVSDDRLTYTFTLRDGLKFHDGAPVTSEDCIASIRRWASRDAMGQKLMTFVKELKAVDDRTFTLALTEPYGLVLESLGKPSSNVPFIMPKRVAETPGNTQIKEFVGSGPFVFRADLWRPGEKTVYEKFKDYKPRPEPASGLAGGKNVHVDRVEWINITDAQTAANALLTGEIDILEQPLHELHPILEKDKNVELFDYNVLGSQYSFRFNVLHKPFDNPRIRQAVFYALNQKDILLAAVNDPRYFKECKAIFICGTPYATDKGFEDKLTSNFAKSKEILKQEGYDGTPVVLLFATDTNTGRLTPIVKSLLERGGFVVDMQAMDWQTVLSRRSRKEPLNAGGWSGFMTSWVSADLLGPIGSALLGVACRKAGMG